MDKLEKTMAIHPAIHLPIIQSLKRKKKKLLDLLYARLIVSCSVREALRNILVLK